jgi:hypothetical protein
MTITIDRKYRYIVDGRFDADDVRLDNAQRVFFAKELEHIDTTVYGMLMPELVMRELVPTIPGIPEHKNAYTYRTSTEVGEAELGGSAGDDVPMVEVSRAEFSQAIETYKLGYYYDDDEIITARNEGVPLDVDRAMACRRGLERKVDRVLALGDSKVGSVGLLNVSGVSTYTLLDKKKGGKGWGTVGEPNATGKEAAADVMGLVNSIVDDSKQAIQRVVVAMPSAKRTFLAETPYQQGSDTTILKYIQANCEKLEAIKPAPATPTAWSASRVTGACSAGW